MQNEVLGLIQAIETDTLQSGVGQWLCTLF